MADTKTSAETAASALTGVELIRGVQSGSNVKITPAQILTYALANGAGGGGGSSAFDSPTYIANNWYFAGLPGTLTTGSTLVTTTQYMYPFYVRQTVTVNALGLRTTTAGTSNVQLGLYANDASPVNRPGALLSNTASIVNTGAAGFYSGALGVNQQLTAGVYWVALQTGDATMVTAALIATNSAFTSIMGSTNGAVAVGGIGGQAAGVSMTSVFGTWNTAHGATFTELNASRTGGFAFQVVSVP